jgi:hypothetical protein
MNQRMSIEPVFRPHLRGDSSPFGCQISALTHSLAALQEDEEEGDIELPALLRPGIATVNETPQPDETPIVEPGKKPVIVDPPAPNSPQPSIPPEPLREPTLPVPDVAPFQ